MSLIARLGIGDKISLAALSLTALIAITAVAGTAGVQRVLDLVALERQMREPLVLVFDTLHLASQFFSAPTAAKANAVIQQQNEASLALERISAPLPVSGLDTLLARLDSYHDDFEALLIESAHQTAIDHRIHALGQSMLALVQQFRAHHGSTASSTHRIDLAAHILELLWQTQQARLASPASSQALVARLHQLLRQLATERIAFEGDLKSRLLLFRIEQRAQEFVASFDSLLHSLARSEMHEVNVQQASVDIQQLGRKLQTAARDEIQQRLRRIQRLTTISFILSLLSAVALSRYLRSEILRPIHKLVKTTRAVAAGALHVRASHAADDEIGTLARAFNDMADTQQRTLESLAARNLALQYSQAELEERVVQRTAALAQTNDELRKQVQARIASEQEIWRQANFDFLTGLPNRRMFRDRLQQEILSAQRQGSKLALLFIDLDRFKEVNDTLGHEAGDELLREAAARIRNCVRETDTVARLGGDEFTLILVGLDNEAASTQVTRKILAALASPFVLAQQTIFVSASIGITFFPSDGDRLEVLMNNADQAMYSAKLAGRNRVQRFTPEMQSSAHRRARIAHELHQALSSEQLQLYLQPIVDLRSGEIRKAEALLRWQHPELGWITPGEFIPIAEQGPLINALGDWVLTQAAAAVLALREAVCPDFQISINKSPAQFTTVGNTPARWLKQLAGLGLPGHAISLEITEGLLLQPSPEVRQQLHDYRAAGFEIALDDFGTGYSSLAFLTRFDINDLKIDRSFIHELQPATGDPALCEAIIVMAHKLGLKVVAEGIETPSQLELLRRIGCDYGQGFLFSRPRPWPELLASLSHGGNHVALAAIEGSG